MGATGSGEENIKVAGAHTIVENMRRGTSPQDAGMDAFALRMGHPVSKPAKHLRVRRDMEMFTYHNGFGNKGLG